MSDEDKKEEQLADDPVPEETSAQVSDNCQNCATLKAEVAEYKSGWQRALADYKNLKKETEDMRGVWAKASEEYILQEFIPIYENFKKAFNVTIDENDQDDKIDKNDGLLKKWNNWKQGIEHIKRQFGDILKMCQIEEIKTVGEKFDPRYHEAVGAEAAEPDLQSGSVQGKIESGIILREVEGGYKRGDKIIKPARVIINK